MKLRIGIDPGSKTGLATWINGALVPYTLTFWGAIKLLDQLHAIKSDPLNLKNDRIPGNIHRRPHAKQTTFHRRLANETQKSYQARMQKIAQNVGENKRDAKLLFEYFDEKGWTYYRMRPRKGSMTKIDAAQFKKITGYKKRTSQHARDAAMLVYGR